MNLTSLIILLCCIIPFLGVYYLIPRIVSIAKKLNIITEPNDRSSHHKKIPRLGGIVFVFNFILGLYLLKHFDQNDRGIMFAASFMVIFIIGIADDLIGISSRTKLMGQLLATSLIFLHPDFYVDNLFGFAGIDYINPYILIPVVAFAMIVVINAYNLIDGIDGLASIIGIIIFIAFGILFYKLNRFFYTGVSIIGCFTLISFLIYNFTKGENKIFMGDTGSMTIGLIISILSLRFISLPVNTINELPFSKEHVPTVILTILIIPLFDVIRVMYIRKLLKKPFFAADKNHLHHVLIQNFQLTHKKTSLYIAFLNVIFYAVMLVVILNTNWKIGFAIFILLIIMLFYLLSRIDRTFSSNRRKVKYRKNIKRVKKLSTKISNLFT